MNDKQLSRKTNYGFYIFYIVFVAIGIIIFPHYGISWDETLSRVDTGLLNCKYVFQGDYQSLWMGNAKFHGPAFEIILIGFENLFGLMDMHSIFLMRHLVTFLLFALAVLLFYRMSLRYLNSNIISLIATVFFILSPRIFADAFYNSKDLAFLSMIVISMHTALRFLSNKTVINALILAVIGAFTIDIRIIGIIIPGFTFLILLIDFFKSIPAQRKKIFVVSVLHFVFLILFIILFWPVMWRDPIGNFILALEENSKFPWTGDVLFAGKLVNSTALPWYYIPLWMMVTTPVLYSVLFVAGLFYFILRKIKNTHVELIIWLSFSLVFLPVIAVIAMHSVLYDGWRHLYFIYPAFIVISAFGLQEILNFFRTKQLIIKSVYIVIIISCSYTVFRMVNLHPYEHLYFNRLAGNSIAQTREKFEMDYWGMTYKEAIERILKRDTSSHIVIRAVEADPGLNNSKMLPERERLRISFTNNTELCDYLITSYRLRHELYDSMIYFNIVRDNGIILSALDIRGRKIKLEGEKYSVGYFRNDIQSTQPNWSDPERSTDKSTGNVSEFIGHEKVFSAGFNFSVPEQLTVNSTSRKYANISVNLKSEKPMDCRIVLQVDSGNSKTYEWINYPVQTSITNEWTWHNFRLRLPEIYSTSDKIVIYIFNPEKNQLLVDDWDISFYSIPAEEAKVMLMDMP